MQAMFTGAEVVAMKGAIEVMQRKRRSIWYEVKIRFSGL
jgi:hypothetical protein